MSELYETFYASDWGPEAPRQRDRRRRTLLDAGATVVRGRVLHPLYGEGWEVYARLVGEALTRDLRVTPDHVYPQAPPRLIRPEEMM